MRLKLDENLPASLGALLRARGHDADTVPDEGLTGRVDADVLGAATREGRVLFTQDLDFAAPATHAGVVLVRLRDPHAAALEQHVLSFTAVHGADVRPGTVAVLTETKVRFRHAAH